VTITAADGVYYDPCDVQINTDPYLAFRGLREEAPLYYNDQHDFYALSQLLARMFTPRKINDLEPSPRSTVRGWEAMPAVLG
jgi:hypothetical protein